MYNVIELKQIISRFYMWIFFLSTSQFAELDNKAQLGQRVTADLLHVWADRGMIVRELVKYLDTLYLENAQIRLRPPGKIMLFLSYDKGW